VRPAAPGRARAFVFAAVLGLGAVAMAGHGDARPRGYRGPPGHGTANPSALVAAEIAFARMAREKGQWSAFREYADEDATMFVPEAVRARDWLKGRDDPPAPVQWQAHQVWMSCDGTLGVTRGAWQRPDGSTGYFTTIWKRQKKGDFRWVLDQGDTLTQPLAEPDMLSASVADCQRGVRGVEPDGTIVVEEQSASRAKGSGRSADGTLTWKYAVAPDRSRTISVSMRKDGGMREVLALSVAAPVAAPRAGDGGAGGQ
jgi:hypothetical protein